MDALDDARMRMDSMRSTHPLLAEMWTRHLDRVRKEVRRIVSDAHTAITDMTHVGDMSAEELAAVWAVRNSA